MKLLSNKYYIPLKAIIESNPVLKKENQNLEISEEKDFELAIIQSKQQELLEIEKDNPKPNDLILIHDGARPFVESATIKKTINAALETGAAISALPVKDTIKEATKDCQFIAKTPPRQLLFAATTPQIFSFEILEKAYATKKDLSSFTDDAQLIETELPEVKIKIVPDTPKNFKITTQEDWDFALWLISHAR